MIWLVLSCGCLLLAVALVCMVWRRHAAEHDARHHAGADAGTAARHAVPRAPSRTPAPGPVRAALPDGDPRRALFALALGIEPQDPHASLMPRPAPSPLVQHVATMLQTLQLPERFIPRRPQLLPQLMGAINDQQASARHLAAIIGQDPALAANLLRVANSPVYRLQSRVVDSIERAVTMVGTEGIRQIISASLVQPVMRVDSPQWPRFSTLVWEHSVLSAAAAADHARSVERGDVFAAQLGGLLDGLGATLVMQLLLERQRVRGEDLPASPDVMDLLGAWSGTVAARVGKQWELPADLLPVLDDTVVQESPAQQSLQRSLEFGRHAAVLVLLQRNGRIDADDAIAELEQRSAGGAHAVQWIWRRLGEATLTLGGRGSS